MTDIYSIYKKLTIGKPKVLSTVKMGLIILILIIISAGSFWGYQLLTINFVRGACITIASALFILKIILANKNISVVLLGYALTIFAYITISSGFKMSIYLMYLPCVLMLIVPDINKQEFVFKCLYYSALLFSFGIVFQILFPSFVESFIIPQFKGFSKFDLLENNIRSAYTGFSYQSAVNAGFITYGLGYLAIRLASGKKERTAINFFALLFLFAMMILCGKRAHFIFTFFSLILVYYFSASVGKKVKRFIQIFIIGILMLIILSWISNFIDLRLFSKLSETFQVMQSNDDIFGYRSTLYRKALAMFRDNPFFGIGWKQFRTVTTNHWGYHLDVHNIYLQLLCETGIIGFSLFSSFFIYSLVKSIKLLRIRTNKTERSMHLFALYIQLFFLMYGVTGNPLYDIYFYVPYFFACAYVHSNYRLLKRNIIVLNTTK